MIEDIKKIKKERDEAIKLLEDVLYCQRLTEYDNKKLREKINLNASLFNKLLGEKKIKGEVILTDEEIIKKNGGYAKKFDEF
jgi:hypothetical protein